MIILLALDDKNGMMFNHRRQSQDSELRKRIFNIAAGHKIYMNAYSAKQFESMDLGKVEGSAASPEIIVSEDFLTRAGAGDYCFVENLGIRNFEAKIEKVIAFKWNRLYPADFKLDLDLGKWKLTASNDFAGSSHEKITEEVYER